MPATLYTADWILPVTQPPLRNGGMLVDADGRIARVAPADSFELNDVRRCDFGAALMLPGLINVHAHPELAAFRGLLEDLPFHQWIPALVRCKRNAALTADDYSDAARWTCIESLRAGITTIGATEDSGAALTALSEAGMRGLVYLEAFGPAPAQAESSLRALHEKVEQHRIHESERVRIGVSPHAPYTVSDALYTLVSAYARNEQLPLATHAAESEAEDLLIREALGPFAAGLRSRGIETTPRGRSTIDMLARTGVLDCAPLLIHAVQLSEDDMRLISDSGAAIAHCPIANARLGHGIAQIVELRERGIPVAIGTDSVASNNRLDLLEEAHVAQALQRARLRSASALASADLLQLVTLESARILGIADRVGSLEEGKDADFCVVRVDTPNSVPVSDALAALFHSARGCDVQMTAVRGEPLFELGTFRHLDPAPLAARMDALSLRLREARDRA